VKLSKRLSSKDRDKLAQTVLDLHRSDPVRLRRTLPEIAQELDRILSPSEPQNGGTSPFGLTDRERGFYRDSLDQVLRKSKSHVVSTDQAIKGLEHAAALLIDNFLPGYPPRQELLRLVRRATGIVPRKTGKPEEKIVRDGEPSRKVAVVRGIDLHLTWDLKLLRVSLDPPQWRLRAQAFSFVGKAADVATDVAEHHDKYLAEVIENA
jgi:hypothetical protein